VNLQSASLSSDPELVDEAEAMDEQTELIGLGKIPSDPRAARHLAPKEEVCLERDCEAVLIPAGMPVTLPAGSRVTISQELGGDFTVMTSWGYMARIAGENADALGREAVSQPAAAGGEGDTAAVTEEQVWDALRKVYDPEIPVSIVELGLVYACRVTALPGGGSRVDIRMTLTAPGCGMGQVLKSDVERKVGTLPGVKEVEVELVFDPPWNRDMMSEAARLELGLF
jgi:probable FeS assembly SUF system protein SufT